MRQAVNASGFKLQNEETDMVIGMTSGSNGGRRPALQQTHVLDIECVEACVRASSSRSGRSVKGRSFPEKTGRKESAGPSTSAFARQENIESSQHSDLRPSPSWGALHPLLVFVAPFLYLHLINMGKHKKNANASIQAYLTPATSPVKSEARDAPVGDGFTAEELQNALKPRPADIWHPGVTEQCTARSAHLILIMLEFEYTDMEISDLIAGPRAVTFMGRVANMFDVANSPRTPRSAKGCVKLCIRDGSGAITVRLWWADRLPSIRLGSLVSIWANHSDCLSFTFRLVYKKLTIDSQQWRAWNAVELQCSPIRVSVP